MSLPTYTEIGCIPPPTTVPNDVVQHWIASFAGAIARVDVTSVVALFLNDGWWRDLLSMTWDFRTFHGCNNITQFLEDRLKISQLSAIKLASTVSPKLVTPYPDLGWIQAMFTFETAIGYANAVIRLVYLPSGEWKAFTLVTSLEMLKGAEPEIDFDYPTRQDYAAARQEEEQFLNEDPTVLIVGAGQSGLGVAARLKLLGVKSLIVERNERVGDQWRKIRYASLRIHDPVWRDQLPLMSMPEPPLWPVFTPGTKLGDWFESYVKLLDLNAWTSSMIRDPKYDPAAKEWTVTVVRNDGTSRTLKTKHIVWATGLNGGYPNMPDFVGVEDFKGPILHSSQFQQPASFAGKKVAVIGSGVSGHDICRDLALTGVDVTMIQRGSTYIMSVKNAIPLQYKELFWKGSPPTEVADLLYQSFPNPITALMSVRVTEKVAELDREMLDGLARVGFRTNMGIDGSGLFRLALKRGGGSYINVGASEMIIDGQIKLKNDSLVDSFTHDGIQFVDGSVLPADAVICATGYGNMHGVIEETFGGKVRSVLKPQFWDFDEEGEIHGIWRDSGHERFYIAYGNLPNARFYSKFLALQIKAMEMGVFGSRYSLV
ncbi:FAD/NAD(P)-binding domain-containing protein [Calocera cornea HHB12733]|uniref:FAD/NAD(P)-binding domain-containing protein n=1 Tax=Calocera cornea HHB12733 TaxID=1353952 RepID=A0A165JUI6_9BASI|nr:FAD/NAD(P)-binding domain-containing protein [Calocera cornea HHB12733]